ncbi:MAG: dephospho-CoA kinase [Actinomycetota bacterium]|nr:dephospho-CoA kinase [Actinomycetota bacterium]
MFVVAVTGGIGSGKSTVAALLADRGAVVVDMDRIARQVSASGGAAYQALVGHFGPGVVGPDGVLDRAAIAQRVFSDPDELAALNAITHPAIAAATLARLVELAERGQAAPPVVLDIPLLTKETKGRYGLAAVVVVDAAIEVAIGRLVQQRGLSEADAQARVRAQASREERRRLADVVVDNGGSRADLEAAVDRLWAWMEAAAGGVGEAGGVAPAGGASVDGALQEPADADGCEQAEEQQ